MQPSPSYPARFLTAFGHARAFLSAPMNVVPLRPRQPAPEPLAFAIGARVDLRVGALVGGVVRPKADDAFAFSNLARLLRAARMTWKERGAYTGLTLAIPAQLHASLEAELLSE